VLTFVQYIHIIKENKEYTVSAKIDPVRGLGGFGLFVAQTAVGGISHRM
jgi:hypothetical protein